MHSCGFRLDLTSKNQLKMCTFQLMQKINFKKQLGEGLNFEELKINRKEMHFAIPFSKKMAISA